MYIFNIYVIYYLVNKNAISERYAFLIGFLALLNYAFLVGGAWARNERLDVGLDVKIYSEKSPCYVRKLIRSVSGGMILYDIESKTYEFRRMDDIKRIEKGSKCEYNSPNSPWFGWTA